MEHMGTSTWALRVLHGILRSPLWIEIMKRRVRETSACRGGDDDLHGEADIIGLGHRAYWCQQSYCFKDPGL